MFFFDERNFPIAVFFSPFCAAKFMLDKNPLSSDPELGGF